MKEKTKRCRRGSSMSLGFGPGRIHRIAMAFGTLVALVGVVFAVELLWRRMRRHRRRDALLDQPSGVHTVCLMYRKTLTHNVRLFRFALPDPEQV